ncbi:unnamed protein product [Linum trigynum]|uniref:Uncharacterized protein n=1 Tax=Linum trigynum TaxID=586398 RepID=A0AAV2GD90_9ROSI
MHRNRGPQIEILSGSTSAQQSARSAKRSDPSGAYPIINFPARSNLSASTITNNCLQGPLHPSVLFSSPKSAKESFYMGSRDASRSPTSAQVGQSSTRGPLLSGPLPRNVGMSYSVVKPKRE